MANPIHYTREELAKTLNPPFFLEEKYEEWEKSLALLCDNGRFDRFDIEPISIEACGTINRDQTHYDCGIYWNEPPAPTSKYGFVRAHLIYYDDGSKKIRFFNMEDPAEVQLRDELVELLATSKCKTIALSDGKEYDRALLLQPDNSLVELSGFTFLN